MCAKVKDLPYVWLRSHYELRTFSINLLKWVGLWTLDSNASPLLKCIYYIYNKIAVSAMFIFAITLFFDMYMMMDDLSIVTDDGCVFAGIVVVLFNVMNYQLRRDKIGRLSNETLQSCEELCQLSGDGFMEILQYYLWRDKVPFYNFCLLGYLLVIALIFFAPTGNGSLPIRARYPFDTTVSPGHEIGFIVEACSIFIGVTAILAVDSLIISFCNLILLQLEILNMNFQRCTTVKVDRTAEAFDNIVIKEGLSEIVQTKTSRNEQFEKYFKTYIRHHQRLVAMIEDINDLFSSSMLVQIFSSTSMICLTGFQAIVISGQDSHLWKYCIYLCAAVSQLLYICWIGNEMITHSSSLAEAQWLSQWHREPLDRTASLLIFSTMFSQKPLRLKAGKFYTLSLETFIAVRRE
ncbi:hypothetical protein KPH14_001219 [Odynerus spinipes]|uniref:Odorant receptor n=1 Tax=Odynerus spinipes TaxID=1348599 RepID=A0AAD9VM23_9HYME|nr:hypothetical protein KPH14_001219 [Odynerus spinipes]